MEYGRLVLPCPVGEWLDEALSYPGVQLLELTPAVAVASIQLPGELHRNPADQIIVATALVHGCPLVTADEKIRRYPYVQVLPA